MPEEDKDKLIYELRKELAETQKKLDVTKRGLDITMAMTTAFVSLANSLYEETPVMDTYAREIRKIYEDIVSSLIVQLGGHK